LWFFDDLSLGTNRHFLVYLKGICDWGQKMDIGNRIEMFVDRQIIDIMDGCELKLNHPVRKEKVLTFDQPWESETSGYITVLDDDGIIRMYYRGITESIKDESRAMVCYAFSEDGINFHRPNLGMHTFEGNKRNNIILKYSPECHNFTSFLDTKPGTPVSKKYKAVGGHERTGINKGKLYGLYSNNGVDWVRYSDEPVITDGMFDSQNVAFFDSNTGSYKCYARYFDNSHLENPEPYHGVRAIKSFESEDFLNWSEPINNEYDVPYKEEFYTNATIQCPGAEHFYLSFPKRFIADRKRDFYIDMDGVSDAVFMSSRDGINWNRTFMEAWVRPGLDRRNWVNRNNMTALGIIETSEKEFSMYISENYRTDTNGIRRLSIRKFGFASVNAGYEGGSFTTKPITYNGDSLYINYSTSAAGHIKISLLDESGVQLTESPIIYGDEIFEKVDFGLSLGQYEGKPVRLRFELKDADIYAIKFGS